VTTVAGPHRKRRAYAARVPAAQRRTELLDAALHLVVTAGHSAVTMDAVAEQAGVTKPVVYGVFGGRADLLDALLRREQEQALAQLAAILPDPLARRPARAGAVPIRSVPIRAAPTRANSSRGCSPTSCTRYGGRRTVALRGDAHADLPPSSTRPASRPER